ncbi:MAG: NAD(P)H-hydrate epimerase [Actinomycetota bacterium]
MSELDPGRVAAVSWVADDAAAITTEEMIEVDRVMIDDLHIELIQMMENAGRQLAHVVRSLVGPTRAWVAAGTGGNGGGGLVAARHLANAGVDVTVSTTRPVADMRGVPAHQADILGRMGVPISVGSEASDVGESDVVVDAVIGYSLHGAPRGVSADLIGALNRSTAPTVSLDVPSGVDATTGSTPGEAVNADATVTLAAPKAGLLGSEHVGELFVADISVPPDVIARVGGAPVPFGPDGLVRVRSSP